ncbi:glycosyltransferase [Corynebacterium guangdongense]|uniref:Glycosyltransferase n=1 Tax=Corynebacterium guangdongense TaxID=1783348 RepID=A0ABU1ZVR4_9CORY|nr:glycosyltransferase [Corynebacterium guangdongense]MDR7328453.1 hypothetical protein [Corynebacterium guangdongense]WJZ17030.1 hypothetical protein CGUA_02150 [Corynebacterium guangdongense]
MWIRYGLGQAVSLVVTLVRLVPLAILNRVSRERLPDATPAGVVISMTTHGARLAHVHYALESLARGNMVAPMVLWLDKKDFDAPWPAPLRRLVDRGLRVRCSDGDYGPHTKYWGTFNDVAGTATRVVTADDDIIYPEWFLERLVLANDISPDRIVAHRAHRVKLNDEGVAPYRRWKPVTGTRPTARNFATGVSGVLYPASFISYVVGQGTRFMGVSPRADDVWLHLCALRSGHEVRQVSGQSRNFAVIPATQMTALSFHNTMFGGNDAQIAQAYTDDDVAVLKAAR